MFALTATALSLLLPFSVQALCTGSLPSEFAYQDINTVHYFDHAGLTRTYRVWIPPDYKQTEQTGLVFSFHGQGGTGLNQFNVAQFNNYAPTSTRWISVYPHGRDDAWDSAPYGNASNDDVGYILELTSYLQSKLCIGPNHIFASGQSNGGGFVGKLACDNRINKIFGAFAASSGAFYDEATANCASASGVPFLEIHGTADPRIPYYGGPHPESGIILPSITSVVQGYASRAGCSSNFSKTTTNSGVVEIHSWNGCKVGGTPPAVQAYNISGLGHEWATLSNSPIVASQVMLDWFDTWPLYKFPRN
ncbi:alpha/beta-hydrolase [Atractiella rhizophila]|nr:alpha/beta-hydrolase [Atractiella rhizophila]